MDSDESRRSIVERITKARAPADSPAVCGVCGGQAFGQYQVLDPRLIADWQIDAAEAAYIERQQGAHCLDCGANLRSMVLARAIASFLGHLGPLRPIVEASPPTARLLEINAAGSLTPLLRRFPHYVFGAYPEVDLQALPFADQAFDMVVHSDTLEHVPDPVRALEECRRVLRPGGACLYTVPIIVGRLTRGRQGLPKSFHGPYEERAEDHVVVTEYGADAWTHAARAGFARTTLDVLDYPTAIAITAWNGVAVP